MGRPKDFLFTRSRLAILCALITLCAAAFSLNSETLTMSTTYPAPTGVYQTMITTGQALLARDGGNVGVGLPNPQVRLDVGGPVRPGSAVSGGACAAEGAFAYDTAAHAPVFCSNSGSWTLIGGTSESFMARFGTSKRCPADAWVFVCGYNPSQAWNYNFCVSRGHAAHYQWNLQWDSAAGGYTLHCNNLALCGWGTVNEDVYCASPAQ